MVWASPQTKREEWKLLLLGTDTKRYTGGLKEGGGEGEYISK